VNSRNHDRVYDDVEVDVWKWVMATVGMVIGASLGWPSLPLVVVITGWKLVGLLRSPND
jgi:hypothetical protein